MAKQKKFIFITGGVLSSIGKGICASSLGMLLEKRGIKVTMVKMDPYINIDPGTMSPFQHGEVFVLDDGAETDLDLGHYSRFVEKANFTKKNSFTTGRVYDAVIRKERSGGYLGKTVQVIPHITNQIKSNICDAAEDADLTIVEVGGTVGDIESLPFLEAIRQMRQDHGAENVIFLHVTLVPYLEAASELKTKPTQHSVKELREIGIQPDFLLCRCTIALPMEVKEKIALFCNLSKDDVISAVDVKNIYEVPLALNNEGLDEKINERLGIWTGRPDLTKWKKMVQTLQNPKGEVTIGIVGKYVDWTDSYKSLSEALVHGGIAHELKVNFKYIDSEDLEAGKNQSLEEVDGILVPGGFGDRGIEGKISAIQFAREKKVPFFGICLGMQLAVVEFARNCCGLKDASSAEFNPQGSTNVIDLMDEQKKIQDKGGTMRLGAYECDILKEKNGVMTHAYQAYKSKRISERHRHRYEFSNQYKDKLEEVGLIISGRHQDSKTGLDLVEMVELQDHPWFLACQFHPEFLSRPLDPHPLFDGFIKAAKEKRK